MPVRQAQGTEPVEGHSIPSAKRVQARSCDASDCPESQSGNRPISSTRLRAALDLLICSGRSGTVSVPDGAEVAPLPKEASEQSFWGVSPAWMPAGRLTLLGSGARSLISRA